jgi:hypothetical protein
MAPSTPAAKIPRWRLRIKGAWLIKIGDRTVTTLAEAQDAFQQLSSNSITTVPLLFLHPEIRQDISHDGLRIVSSAPFTEHIHDQLNHQWVMSEFRLRITMPSPTQESVGGTSSYGTPEDLFTQESSSEIIFDERPPHQHGAPCTAVTTDAASRRPSKATLLVKRLVHVSHSLSVTIAPPAREGGSNCQKTALARQDLCCFCAVGATCSSCNCSCAKAGRPCQSCDP